MLGAVLLQAKREARQEVDRWPGVFVYDERMDPCCELMSIEGLSPPRRYNARFQLETVFADRVDGRNRQSSNRTKDARMLF
jgi:hypothetical protein